MAGGQGVEPQLTHPECAVLPLDDPPIFFTHIEYFKNEKNSSDKIEKQDLNYYVGKPPRNDEKTEETPFFGDSRRHLDFYNS